VESTVGASDRSLAHISPEARHIAPVLRLLRPSDVLAGFHAEFEDPAAPVRHAGEQWAPTRYLIGEHRHTHWELYLQAHGTSRWRVGSHEYALPRGHVLAVGPGWPHAMVERPQGRHHFFYVALDVAALGGPSTAETFGSARAHHLRDAASTLGAFRLVVQEVLNAAAGIPHAVSAAAELLVVETVRVLNHLQHGTAPSVHPAVGAARQLMDERFDEAWTVASLARDAGLSPNYFGELFARDVGQTPHTYLVARRIERAKELLAQNQLAIGDIAITLGYSSGSHFARSFRSVEGCSPTAYRAVITEPE
jgi:AraC-like DNA-binding protein